MPSLQGLAWRNIGPAVAGGRTSGVAGTDSDPNLYYFGGADGGVWKTTNGGLTWQSAWPQRRGRRNRRDCDRSPPSQHRLGRNRRTKPAQRYLVRRRRLGHSRRRLTLAKPRIARHLGDRADRDRSTQLAAPLGGGGRQSLSRQHCARYLPNDRRRKNLAAHALSGPFERGLRRGSRPRHPNVVFAGVWQFRRVPWSFSSGGPLDGIFKSVDGGVTWRELRGNGLPRGDMGRIGLGVAGKRIYAVIQSKEGVAWRSDDGGAHWRLITRDTLVNQRPFYMSRLAVDPSNPDRVFFSSEDLIETTDGGKTYRRRHERRPSRPSRLMDLARRTSHHRGR